jgi:sugar phosphate permease
VDHAAGWAVPPLWALSAKLAVGVLGGSVNGASGRAVMRWFGAGERGFAMSIRQTAVPLGGGLGALILPSLASLRLCPCLAPWPSYAACRRF